jgi:hypothetical protein
VGSAPLGKFSTPLLFLTGYKSFDLIRSAWKRSVLIVRPLQFHDRSLATRERNVKRGPFGNLIPGSRIGGRAAVPHGEDLVGSAEATIVCGLRDFIGFHLIPPPVAAHGRRLAGATQRVLLE